MRWARYGKEEDAEADGAGSSLNRGQGFRMQKVNAEETRMHHFIMEET